MLKFDSPAGRNVFQDKNSKNRNHISIAKKWKLPKNS